MAPLPHSEAAGGRDVQVYQKESTNNGQKGAGQRLWGWHGDIPTAVEGGWAPLAPWRSHHRGAQFSVGILVLAPQELYLIPR